MSSYLKINIVIFKRLIPFWACTLCISTLTTNGQNREDIPPITLNAEQGMQTVIQVIKDELIHIQYVYSETWSIKRKHFKGTKRTRTQCDARGFEEVYEQTDKLICGIFPPGALIAQFKEFKPDGVAVSDNYNYVGMKAEIKAPQDGFLLLGPNYLKGKLKNCSGSIRVKIWKGNAVISQK